MQRVNDFIKNIHENGVSSSKYIEFLGSITDLDTSGLTITSNMLTLHTSMTLVKELIIELKKIPKPIPKKIDRNLERVKIYRGLVSNLESILDKNKYYFKQLAELELKHDLYKINEDFTMVSVGHLPITSLLQDRILMAQLNKDGYDLNSLVESLDHDELTDILLLISGKVMSFYELTSYLNENIFDQHLKEYIRINKNAEFNPWIMGDKEYGFKLAKTYGNDTFTNFLKILICMHK